MIEERKIIDSQENLGENYSKIISPEQYNTLMSEQHLYINAADHYIAKTISNKLAHMENPEVIEIGCGPARITGLIHEKNKNALLYGIDVDTHFIKYAQEQCIYPNVKFIKSSVYEYKHRKPVSLFYSEGFHHHIPIGEPRNLYLMNILEQLESGGYYIVGDEFIADYKDNSERETNLVLWYSHIIANARSQGFDFLAQEEAKTLLDDLYEGRSEYNIKTTEQISLTLDFAEVIEKRLKEKMFEFAVLESQKFLNKLKKLHSVKENKDQSISLSRGDFKISKEKFIEEVEKSGFIVENFKSFGPASNVGCMGVFTLRKL
jgi:SAM-dependent methyltransferase